MKLFKKILNISLIVWIINQSLNALFDGRRSFFESFIDPQSIVTNFTFSFLTTAVIMIFFLLLDKKLSWEKQGKIKLIIGIIGSIIIVTPLFFILRAINFVLILKIKSFSEFISESQLHDYIFSMIFTMAMTFFFLMIEFFKALQEKKVTEQKIIAGTATAKFNALKNQLDPHFLFNSLNVLTSLIEENPRLAQKFTTSLSKVYRYVLEQKNKDVVEVEEELKFAKIYMSLLQMRFEDSIFLKLPEKLENPEAKIVPLSLQLLLENTVKHNVVSEEKPLCIKIYEEKGFLYVVNNLQPKAIMKTESGVGLANISQRYDMLSNRSFSVEKTKDEFIAQLPILTKKIITVKKQENISETPKSLDYDLAKEKVDKIRGFYISLIMYCIMIPFFMILNFKTSPQYHWFYFPLVGWGFGLIVHGLNTYKNHWFLGKNWEQRKLKQFLEEENTNR